MLYRIKQGESFRDDDGKLKTGGDTIEIADDCIEQHRHRVEPVEPAADAPAVIDVPTE